MRQLFKTRNKPTLNPLFYCAVLGLASLNANAQSSSTNQGSLTPVRAASIATSTAITNTIVNNPFGGFGVFRYRFGANGQNGNTTGLALTPNQNSDANTFSGGLAGSADFSNWSLWATPVVSQFKNNVAPNTSNGTVVLGLMGLEYNFDDRLISGVSLAADSTNSNTTYNGGTYKSTGLTVSPYIAYQVSGNWLADLSVGYGGSNPTTTVGGSTGTTNYTRFFAATGLSNRIQMDKLIITPRASYTMYKDSLDAYTSSTGTYNSELTTYLYQTKVGAQASYDVKIASPFIAAYQIINTWSASQAGTPSSVYPSTYQLIAGINASKGIFYGTVAYQMERSASQFRLYGGLRF
jgi:hypothetical protein